MDIYPEDLEPVYRSQMQKERDLAEGSFTETVAYSFFGGIFGGLLSECVNLWMLNVNPGIPVPVLIADIGVGGSLGYVCGFFVDRKNRWKKRTKNLTLLEVGMLHKDETDTLKIAHLSLVSELVSMRPFQDTSMEKSIRNAIRNIGSGVANLPGQPAEELLLDAKTFRAEASRLAAEAAQENDTVIAASLQRQAAAQSQRAGVIFRNSALARRNQILRDEMSGHIKALKTMLASMALDDRSSGYDLAALAENIHQVANEANSLTEAKKELASALDEEYGNRTSVIPEQTQLYGLSG